ncbi:MAG: hypothetical protein IKC24_00165 [Oscillospiraceae bacterium]|nr:hypothetical protein [Oscillospiraceae bacterium]
MKGTAADNKKVFDNLVRNVVAEQLNGLVDDLSAKTAGASGISQLGMTPIAGLNAANAQAALEELKNWLEQAIIGAGGVASFNGRRGAVKPQIGDYTAAMVGAAPAGCTNNANVYVSASGNDATGNGTSTSPYATIQKAINSIPKNLGGYTIRIYIAPGTYEETVKIQSFISGTIALLNQETEKPKITGNIQVENNNCSVSLYSLEVTGNMFVAGNTHVHIEGCDIISNTAFAINIVNNGEVFIRGGSVLATGAQNYKGAITVSMSLCSITASTIQEGTTLGLSSVNGSILYTTSITNNASTKTIVYQGKIYE